MAMFQLVLTNVHTVKALQDVIKLGEVKANQQSPQLVSSDLIIAVDGPPGAGILAIVKDVGPVILDQRLATLLGHISGGYFAASIEVTESAKQQMAAGGSGMRRLPLMVPAGEGMLTGTITGAVFNTQYLATVRVINQHKVEFEIVISRQRYCTAQLTMPATNVSNYAAKFEFVKPYAQIQYAVNILKYGRATGRTEADLQAARAVVTRAGINSADLEQLGNLPRTATRLADEAEAQTWVVLAERKNRHVSDIHLVKIVRKTVYHALMHTR